MSEKSGGELRLGTFSKTWLAKEIKLGKKSQIKLITLVLLLGLISASSLVIASNLLNETANQSITALEILPNFSLENRTVESFNETTPSFLGNETNATESNETFEINETNLTQTNETFAEIPIKPPEIPIVPRPEITVSLEYPEKITRGEDFKIKARIENSSPASLRIVEIEWKLPKDFEIVSRNEDCKVLSPNSACTSEILVHSSLSTKLGNNEIKVVIKYE